MISLTRHLTSIAAVLLLALSIGLVGCDGAVNDEANEDANAEASEPAAEENATDDAPAEDAGESTASRADRDGEARDPAERRTDDIFQTILDGDEAWALELIDQGVPVDARDDRDVSVLHFAARATMPELTRVLLEGGADVHAVIPQNGDTPIHWASRAGASDRPNSAETVDVLLEFGADINGVNDTGHRPVDYAILADNEQWLEALIERGAELQSGE